MINHCQLSTHGCGEGHILGQWLMLCHWYSVIPRDRVQYYIFTRSYGIIDPAVGSMSRSGSDYWPVVRSDATMRWQHLPEQPALALNFADMT